MTGALNHKGTPFLLRICHGLLAVMMCVASAPSFAAGGELVHLYKTYTGNIRYVAVGKSFRNQPNAVDDCSFVNPMQSSVSVNLPVGATIKDAFLYFAGSADIAGDQGGNIIDLNDQTNLKLNGVVIPVNPGANGTNFTNLTNLGTGDADFFGARRDVSDIVTGSGTYTLSGMTIHTEAVGRTTTGTCLAAWSLIVVFKDPTVTKIRTISIFDGFQDFKNSSFELFPRNFVVAAGSPTGKMTHMTYEGDEQITGTERFELEVGNSGFLAKTNALNPIDNQYNSTTTGPDVFDTSTSYGFDLDTYDIAAQLATQVDKYTATTRYVSGTDLVLLMAEVLSVDNKDLADIEVTLAPLGIFQSSSVNGAQYRISVTNNGDDSTNPATGFATGYIHVYDDLPSGITIDSPLDITAPGWDCAATNLGTGQVRCTYDLSSLSGAKLNKGESLPDILITADVATPASPVTNRAYVSLCSYSPDTCTTFDNKHTESAEFDPVNFFEPSENLFDVLAKSVTNNNVDQKITPIITGTPSDLSTSTKTVVDVNGGTLLPGDLLDYTITLQESANIAAMGVAISDVIDTDTINFLYQSNTCGGVSPTYTGGVFTISGMSVPANGQCNVKFQVQVRSTASAGTTIDNAATISNGNGIDGTPVAPTLLVAGAGAGMKPLYLDNLDTSTRRLKRTAPATNTATNNITVGTNRVMTLTPVLAKALTVKSGVIPASVWVQANTAGTYSLTATLRYGATIIGSANTLSGVTMATGTANAQLFPFQITVPGNVNIPSGANINLTIQNNGGSAGSVILHSKQQGIESSVVLDTSTVVNVDSVTFYSDVARTVQVTSIEAGKPVYIEGVVSDPFGSADITGATLNLVDPTGGYQLTNATMTQVATTASTRTYAYTYNMPSATTIPTGIWTAHVKAYEGYEGTVTHTTSATLTTTAPAVSVSYTVNKLTAVAGEQLTYTVTINNTGAATAVSIDNLPIPNDTENLAVTLLPSGTNTSTASVLNITGITANTGDTVIQFTVDVVPGATKGTIIDHTIVVANGANDRIATADSVLVDPYAATAGNKSLYADNLGTSAVLDRTAPLSETTRTIASQGASSTLTLSPTLQSSLILDDYTTIDVEASIWVSVGTAPAGQRTLQATLGYAGAISGTIGTDSVTLALGAGAASAQYLPFEFDLPNDLILPANTSLTLTLQNNTAIAGESITVHSTRVGEDSHVTVTAIEPLTIEAIEFFNNSIDLGGTLITDAGPGDTIWVRATVQDPFGAADVTAAYLTITDPVVPAPANVTLNNQPMSVPTTQPASGAQKYFQWNHTLTSELGDWDVSVTANEGFENLVSASANVTINVNNLVADLSDSYKFVTNTTTGQNNNTNGGDTLHYTISLVEIAGTDATNVSVDDVIPPGTTFVPGSLTVDAIVQADPAPDINLSGLIVPASGSVTIEFDVTVDAPGAPGTIIANSADIAADGIATFSVNAEDIVIAGPPASGTKTLYLEDLNTGSPYLTRLQPQTVGAGDSVVLENAGGSISLNLTPALASDITIDPVDGDIPVRLRMNAVGQADRNRSITVELAYHNGGSPTPIGTVTRDVFLGAAIGDEIFNIPLGGITTIPAGYQLQLTVTNNQGQNNRDLQLYSFDSVGNRSTIDIVPDTVINVDSITFWTDTLGAGVQVTNPDPGVSGIGVYAKVVISDPFGEADIQAPDALINPTTITIANPDANATLSGTSPCTAPCYAYDQEDTTNDLPGDATRTFYFYVGVDPTPTATRGTWIATVTAHEGLEGLISHSAANSFSTAIAPNLSTSTKSYTNVGDVDPGDILTYVITVNNLGGVDADNVTFSDTLQASPVPLTFLSASTTCTDEVAAPLPNPSHAGGVVTLSNISATSAGSCTITVNTTVGAGSPGSLIDNSATLTNPGGPGGTPVAATIILSESQVPQAGSKQLYLAGLNGTSELTRTQPGASNITLANGGGTTQLVLTTPITRAMTIDDTAIDVNLYLSETGNGSNRAVQVTLEVDPDGASGYQTIDSQQQVLALTGAATLYSYNLNLTGAVEIPLLPGALFRLTVTNNQPEPNRNVILYQQASAPYSEIVVPLIGVFEISDVRFYDLSGTDAGGCAPNCGTEITPAYVQTGNSIWMRATLSDAFGAADVNTGCDGVTTTNCPTLTIANPLGGDETPASPANELVFLQSPDASSRQYEYQIVPGTFMDGLSGIWQVNITGTEGIEGVVFDIRNAEFERYDPAEITLVKSTSQSVGQSDDIVTLTNDIENIGEGNALFVDVTNEINDFVKLELVAAGGQWTGILTLTGSQSFTVASEQFDDGDDSFTFDPVTECGAAILSNSPCYSSETAKWKILLNEPMPPGATLQQQYHVRLR